jgi:putative transposase
MLLYTTYMERKFKSNLNIVYSCKYHIIWCPKYRRKVLIEGVDVRLKQILQEVCIEFGADHVHVLIEVDPQFGVMKLLRYLKGRSSRLLREEFPWLKSRLPTLWTNSSFIATVGGAPLSAIKQYIENQKNV